MTNSNLNARLKAVADAVDFTHRLLSAANTPNATLVSADARTLHGIQVYNAGTATGNGPRLSISPRRIASASSTAAAINA